ncbi:SHOCT domain-containing protein [Flavobacterium piscinae]|uniref:SHOCT domain-containing protein n=1 Tax=Flavobacterium piscinae TaxID=2506424 RepID=A0A4V1N424_9FLAO|nr:SHOCT domain-containing protein [Flavobacterium piscinae]MBC8884447.1 SHOCT domain-containing protein [Flavobacterium piscinae]RXR30676.1 hypothetical protein EQG68_11500 [Flavobacterium piscinae]
MEQNVGVGIIVGLVVGSTTYVYNSEDLKQGQKVFLYLCVLFPPLQWLLIFVFLGYNNYLKNNSAEKVEERKVEQHKNKIDITIQNLYDLKKKGILTDVEYNQKVEKLEAEKTEQEIKNSIEYKQLKSLLDLGVLTKEEFESKSKLLSNMSENKIDIIEVSKIQNSETYLNDIKNTTKPFEEKSLVGTYIINDKKYFYSYNNILTIEDYSGKSLNCKWYTIDKNSLKLIIDSKEVIYKNIQFTDKGFTFHCRNVKYNADKIN